MLEYFNGMIIVEDPNMTDTIEDWSRVRSPARARRRRSKHPQNIRFILVPKQKVYCFGNKLIMHPEMAKELMRQASLMGHSK